MESVFFLKSFKVFILCWIAFEFISFMSHSATLFRWLCFQLCESSDWGKFSRSLCSYEDIQLREDFIHEVFTLWELFNGMEEMWVSWREDSSVVFASFVSVISLLNMLFTVRMLAFFIVLLSIDCYVDWRNCSLLSSHWNAFERTARTSQTANALPWLEINQTVVCVDWEVTFVFFLVQQNLPIN